MSTDFSVRPAGVPAVTPIARAAPEAARDAVPTLLPAAQSVVAAEAAKGLHRESLKVDQERLSRKLVLDQDSAQIVYRVVDRRTESVVQQIPDEAKLRARAYFREIERARSVSHSPHTDRLA